ncbi:LysR substrate-binding domain-containing protein [Streptomyces sp. NBC_00083]|uniref:LysR substrate-binding domain-containing protein n=1 Tax=Streptomyces sp. NBC_00083 TaxID=2975647 RepID=UPI002257B07A|nr:LysR substrate-binding domain-containing protein [Streptomyces sp. NBC_00083]MCX5382409.1 LysR substrate-binding domain-containing protein [Streptomyces sp. NBC_00083]
MSEWDIKKLHILRTLREQGTVTATAEVLLMTPSAVSQQLSNLAKQLGVTLLEAHGRRVRLTDAAHLVLRHAEAVFAQLERADAELAGYLQGEAGEVRVGAFSTAVPALVVPAVQQLRRSHPALEVRVREAEAAEAYELLSAGSVDLALSLAAHAPSARDPKFALLPLLTDPLDVALPAGHPLAAEPGLRLADLAHEAWIFGGSGPWSEITTAACEAAGFVPEQAHSAAGWTAILAMVEAGMGVALVPRMAAADRRAGVVMRVLSADQPRRHVVAAVRRGAEEGPAVARVLAALREVANVRPAG